jgi:hypothetical protein
VTVDAGKVLDIAALGAPPPDAVDLTQTPQVADNTKEVHVNAWEARRLVVRGGGGLRVALDSTCAAPLAAVRVERLVLLPGALLEIDTAACAAGTSPTIDERLIASLLSYGELADSEAAGAPTVSSVAITVAPADGTAFTALTSFSLSASPSPAVAAQDSHRCESVSSAVALPTATKDRIVHVVTGELFDEGSVQVFLHASPEGSTPASLADSASSYFSGADATYAAAQLREGVTGFLKVWAPLGEAAKVRATASRTEDGADNDEVEVNLGTTSSLFFRAAVQDGDPSGALPLWGILVVVGVVLVLVCGAALACGAGTLLWRRSSSTSGAAAGGARGRRGRGVGGVPAGAARVAVVVSLVGVVLAVGSNLNSRACLEARLDIFVPAGTRACVYLNGAPRCSLTESTATTLVPLSGGSGSTGGGGGNSNAPIVGEGMSSYPTLTTVTPNLLVRFFKLAIDGVVGDDTSAVLVDLAPSQYLGGTMIGAATTVCVDSSVTTSSPRHLGATETFDVAIPEGHSAALAIMRPVPPRLATTTVTSYGAGATCPTPTGDALARAEASTLPLTTINTDSTYDLTTTDGVSGVRVAARWSLGGTRATLVTVGANELLNIPAVTSTDSQVVSAYELTRLRIEATGRVRLHLTPEGTIALPLRMQAFDFAEGAILELNLEALADPSTFSLADAVRDLVPGAVQFAESRRASTTPLTVVSFNAGAEVERVTTVVAFTSQDSTLTGQQVNGGSTFTPNAGPNVGTTTALGTTCRDMTSGAAGFCLAADACTDKTSTDAQGCDEGFVCCTANSADGTLNVPVDSSTGGSGGNGGSVSTVPVFECKEGNKRMTLEGGPPETSLRIQLPAGLDDSRVVLDIFSPEEDEKPSVTIAVQAERRTSGAPEFSLSPLVYANGEYQVRVNAPADIIRRAERQSGVDQEDAGSLGGMPTWAVALTVIAGLALCCVTVVGVALAVRLLQKRRSPARAAANKAGMATRAPPAAGAAGHHGRPRAPSKGTTRRHSRRTSSRNLASLSTLVTVALALAAPTLLGTVQSSAPDGLSTTCGFLVVRVMAFKTDIKTIYVGDRPAHENTLAKSGGGWWENVKSTATQVIPYIFNNGGNANAQPSPVPTLPPSWPPTPPPTLPPTRPPTPVISSNNGQSSGATCPSMTVECRTRCGGTDKVETCRCSNGVTVEKCKAVTTTAGGQQGTVIMQGAAEESDDGWVIGLGVTGGLLCCCCLIVILCAAGYFAMADPAPAQQTDAYYDDDYSYRPNNGDYSYRPDDSYGSGPSYSATYY